MTSKKSVIMKTVMILGVIVLSSIITILAHAILPAKVDESRLDSILVAKLGFPIVAVIYFVILYTQCSISIVFSVNSSYSRGSVAGFYLGIAYALIYMIGMQEIILDLSPFGTWTVDFIKYQVLMGLGDAIPVIVLCSVSGRIASNKKNGSILTERRSRYSILLFAIVVGTERTVFSLTGVIHNTINTYPLPVIIWNYVFGCIIGICYMLIEKHYRNSERLMVVGISVNWIIFNIFIGMIKRGAMFDALLRSGIDTLIIIILTRVIVNKRCKLTIASI